MQTVSVFCGSSFGTNSEYRSAATVLGREIASRGMTLVYGGGHVGLMGAIADAALAAGGKVIGVIPTDIAEHEVQHDTLTELHVVDSMHERKMRMAKLSDGMIAMPGGLGTLEEIFEVWTWAQLGFHGKPCAMLNVAGYYDGLLAFLDRSVSEGFVKQVHRDMLYTGIEPAAMLDWMNEYQPEPDHLWRDLDRS
ncbi:TIGR00730 family Rossman fold protein [Halieaceae bacterium IMCC14734]|uniref:Cytokinin riboside 5'-monophosphate phosphoribohydrolase n=1 Tax=Candidatus Litorirhabdus singularis TaxID=2518993 RepID=A0ABT3TLA9_9GAMM|nr:TIGR00730 family Rossman fold protein [Candidatus Litorirhabdus singularis]MCX2983103.1 TIGR00730 family Rossman fold protein [Candidatus Litorirhabdus singularis]